MAIIVFFFSLPPTCFDLSYLKCLSMLDSQQSSRKEKVSFTACYPGKLYLACTNLKAILTSPNFFLWMGLITVLLNLNSLKNFTFQPGKLKMQLISWIIKSSTPGLFPGHCSVYSLKCTLFNIIWLQLEPLNAFLTTLLLGNRRQTSQKKLLKYLYNLSTIFVYASGYSCIAYN